MEHAHGRPRVGALFNPSLHPIVERSLERLDYLAFIPDRGWIDHGRIVNGRGTRQRFETHPQAQALLEQAAAVRPIVLHGIGLSICSAGFFDEAYAQNLIDWAKRLNSPWISDHLSFTRVGTGHEVNAAIPLPVPYDPEVLDLLIPRLRFIEQRSPCPFLLENNVYYFSYADQKFTEEEFLNSLCAHTGCGVLLDLHNLYTNALNHRFSALDYLNNLDLTRVTEIHIAGGVPMMGFHTDSHTGPVLEGVWDLLEYTVPRARNLRGVTFEFHESSFTRLGETGFFDQIERARATIETHVPQSLSASAG